MFTMQTFYARLRSSGKSRDSFFKILRQLATCTLAEVNAVKSEMVWEVWDQATD